jgi:hypothetical protein
MKKTKLEEIFQVAVITGCGISFIPGAVGAPAHDIHCAVITVPNAWKGGDCDRVPDRHPEHSESTADSMQSSVTSSVDLIHWR